MAIEIIVPRLGWDMEKGVFGGWLKKHGESVSAGDALFALETEKATQDVEAIDSGILCVPADGSKTGDTVEVGKVIGHLLQVGEAHPVASGPSASTAGTSDLAPSSPSVRRQARDLGVDLRHVTGTGPGGRIVLEDISGNTQRSTTMAVTQRPVEATSIPTISPRAKRAAVELGVDWKVLRGSGRTGRIRERDVRAANRQGNVAVPATVHSTAKEMPASLIRKTIAERMLQSARSTAPVTLTTKVDVSNLVNLRRQFKESAGPGAAPIPGYNDFFIKLTALVLRDHPTLNARWTGERITLEAEIHIGMAVDTEAGLLVPVLRDVPSLGIREVAARSRDLIERGRNRKLLAEELRGGTFTVTNLGAFGIDAFTPIINYPECAILGIGRIQSQPVVVDQQIVIRDMTTLSLTFDHRIVDGAPAARFLQALGRAVEHPSPWLMP